MPVELTMSKNWIRIDENTLTFEGSEFIYHIAEGGVGLAEGISSFNVHGAQTFATEAVKHLNSLKGREIIVLNPEVRAFLDQTSHEVRMGFLLQHGNYDWDIHPLHNPDWCKSAADHEMKRFREVEAKVAEILKSKVVGR